MGEGVGRSQSVIVVRDDLGVLEIFANQFESKAETAQAICGLAQKWQIGVEGIIFDGNGNTGRNILRALERRYSYGLEPFFGSRPGGRWYTNLAHRVEPFGHALSSREGRGYGASGRSYSQAPYLSRTKVPGRTFRAKHQIQIVTSPSGAATRRLSKNSPFVDVSPCQQRIYFN